MSLWSHLLGWLGFSPTVAAPAAPAGELLEEHGPADRKQDSQQAAAPQTAEQPTIPEDAWWLTTRPAESGTGPSEVAPDDAQQALTKELHEFIESPNIDLPHLPHIPQRVLTALRQADINYPAVAKVLSQDQTLSAGTLRLANSAAYTAALEITNLEVALSRLGMRGIRNLMIKESIKAITIVKTARGDSVAEKLWRKSIACGLIMEKLVAVDGFGLRADDAFLLGLLHDIGEVVLLRLVHDYERISRQQVPQPIFEQLCREHHQRFGSLLAESWSLPSTVCPVIEHHHGPIDAQDPHVDHKYMVQICDLLAGLLGHGPADPDDLLKTPAARHLNFGRCQQHLDFLQCLPDELHLELSLAF